jgi:hypothetical protein
MQTNYRVPRAVGKQPPGLGWSFFDWFSDYEKPAPLARTSSMDNFWNAGVNMAYGRESAYAPRSTRAVARSGGDSDMKPRGYRSRSWNLWGEPTADVGVEAFNRASTYAAYGNMDGAKAELGDLFNDIMGAVVPGWDSRPDALKKIVVKPDPAKVIAMAQKVAPNAAGDIVRAANANGMAVYVNTPAGQVNVTPDNAQLYYGNYQFLTKAQDMLGSFGSLSPMTWLAVGGIGLGLFLMMKR